MLSDYHIVRLSCGQIIMLSDYHAVRLSHCERLKIVNVLYSLHANYPDQFNEISSKLISKTISTEVKNLSKSKFFNSQVKDSVHLKEFKFDSQYKEASTKAPYTLKLIIHIGTNPRNGRNKKPNRK